MTTQLSILVNDETDAALRSLAKEGETSVAEIIRRAVGLYQFLKAEEASGRQIVVKSRWPNSNTRIRLL